MFLCIAALPIYRVATGKPILASTPGDWDGACGDWYIKTTRLAVWNPIRDQTPERAAESFLQELRANNCASGIELCESALPNRRVSHWKLVYRGDDSNNVTLYFRPTKDG